MKNNNIIYTVSILFIFLLLIPSSIFQVTAQMEGLNWEHPAFDRTNTGFSPQTQINKDNIDDLELRWIFQVPGYWGSGGGVPGEVISVGDDGHEHGEGGFNFEVPHVPTGVQTVPLVVNGIVYIASEFNVLYALNAESSQLLWRFAAPIGSFDEKNWWAKVYAQHGIDYFDEKVWMQASDCTIYGLEPLTGEILVNIPDTCKDIPGNTGIYWASFAPIEYNNLLITRPTGGGGFTGERGFIAAYDKNTGELVWRWETIPPTGNEENWAADLVSKGNLDNYPWDWGKCEAHDEDEEQHEGLHDCNWIGGGSVWTLIALDEETGDIFFTTNAPTPDIPGDMRPGPNLFTASVVSLKANTGEMNWYYQIVTHDIYYHESRWSTILAEIESGDSTQKAVIVGSKTNLVHVIDAKTGKPIYESIRVGPPPINTQQADMGNNADMELSQADLIQKQVCPGFQGGIDAAPAFAHNTIYVVTQTFCTSYIAEEEIPYKDGEADILHHIAGPMYFDSFHVGNASLYAIDASNGRVKWVYEMENRNQYGAVTTSGGIVFVPDRLGKIHAVDEETGELLRIFTTGGLGGAGVSIGSNAYGQATLFITSGGAGEFGQRTTGILQAYTLADGSEDNAQTPQTNPNILSIVSLGIAVIAIAFSMYVVKKNRSN